MLATRLSLPMYHTSMKTSTSSSSFWFVLFPQPDCIYRPPILCGENLGSDNRTILLSVWELSFPSPEQISITLQAWMNALEAIGLTSKHIAQMQDWVKTRYEATSFGLLSFHFRSDDITLHRSVTLRFVTEEKCKFLRKVRVARGTTEL